MAPFPHHSQSSYFREVPIQNVFNFVYNFRAFPYFSDELRRKNYGLIFG
jgi:hypothetical protein